MTQTTHATDEMDGAAPAEATHPAAPNPLHRAFARVQPYLARFDDFLFDRKPKLLATILTMVGVAVLLGLGTWQMARLQQKNTILQDMQAQLLAAPTDLRSHGAASPDAWKGLNYKPVVLSGTWMTLRSFKLAPRTYEEQVGYQFILPLKLKDGQIVLVNRGFVPDGAAIVPPNESTEVTVHGVARLPDIEKPEFMPENDPSRGNWVWIDMKAMGQEVGVQAIAPVIIYEDRVEGRDTYPIGGQLPLPSHNRHWHYAVTWYCLALALLGVWMIATSPKQQKPEDANKNATEESMDPVAIRGRYPEATD